MPNGKSKYLFIPILLGDIFILLISFFIAYQFEPNISLNLVDFGIRFFGASGIWILIVLQKKIYDIPRFIRTEKIMMLNLESLIIFFLFSTTILYFSSFLNNRQFYLVFFVFFASFQLTWHLSLLLKIKKMRVKGLNFRSVILVGFNQNMELMIRKIQSTPDIGYRIAGLFTNSEPNELTSSIYRGDLNEIEAFCEENQVHHMIVSLPQNQSDRINDLIHFGDNNLIRVKIIPEFSEYLSRTFFIDYVDHIPILRFRQEPLESLSNKLIKRVFDISFSALVLVFICSWLFPIIAILIKLSSMGPVFFIQERSGKRGYSFNCLKFRTMRLNDESNEKQATRNDTRITPIGRFLRKTSLDEFPQFINVFRGEMSVVGPRPHMLKHTEMYSQLVNKFMVRHFAKPGITGWAQIKGYRGETKEVEDMKKRAEADIWYLENWSLLLDIKIILLTAWNIVVQKNENVF